MRCASARSVEPADNIVVVIVLWAAAQRLGCPARSLRRRAVVPPWAGSPAMPDERGRARGAPSTGM